MEPDPTPAHLRDVSTSLSEVHNFEAIFRIPPAHELIAVRSRTQAGPMAIVSWEHDEYDSCGSLVARYKSFEQVDAAGEKRSGWQKFDSDGHLLHESERLR